VALADCCKETDDFDLCLRCHEGGTSCECSDQQMQMMQKCVAGDVLASEKGDARRRLANMAELRCAPCQRLVTQGRYYCEWTRKFKLAILISLTLGRICCTDCAECSDDTDFDMCQDCYRQGKTCHSPDHHRLYVYLRANVDRPHPDFATDGISCAGCEAKITQGPFYCE
jgi:hypothetical protein